MSGKERGYPGLSDNARQTLKEEDEICHVEAEIAKKNAEELMNKLRQQQNTIELN